jgi:hypothetical protein
LSFQLATLPSPVSSPVSGDGAGVPDRPIAERLPCTILGSSASNFLSSGCPDVIALIEQDHALWQLLLDWEEEYCGEPGAVDSATHLLFALERSPSS